MKFGLITPDKKVVHVVEANTIEAAKETIDEELMHRVDCQGDEIGDWEWVNTTALSAQMHVRLPFGDPFVYMLDECVESRSSPDVGEVL